jgi:hypothetical protein
MPERTGRDDVLQSRQHLPGNAAQPVTISPWVRNSDDEAWILTVDQDFMKQVTRIHPVNLSITHNFHADHNA